MNGQTTATPPGSTASGCSAFRWKVMDVAYADNLHNPRCLVLEVNPKYPRNCYTTCSQSDGIGSHSDTSLRSRDEWLKWLERFSDDLTGRELREAREAVMAPFEEPTSWAGFRRRYAETGDPWLPDPPQELPVCACVSHDAVTCAAKRDGLACDDPRYEVRRCECVCHSEDREGDDE